MPKFEYTPQISLGNMLTILSMVVGMAVAWGANEIRISAIEATQNANAARVSALEERVRTNENAIGRQDERWSNLVNTLARIERTIDALADKLEGR